MRRWVVTLLMTGLLGAAVAPASATDEIGLSHDGVRWSDTLTEPLFDPDTVWVPGDSRTVSFYVRNQADSNATLTTTVRTGDRDNLLADDHVTLRARAGGRWIPLRNGSPSSELTDASIRPGAPVKVEVEASFAARSTNVSQSQSVRLVFEVRLTDATARQPDDRDDADDADDADDDRPGWLPKTGAGAVVTLLWLGGILVMLGAVLAFAGRRKREQDHV